MIDLLWCDGIYHHWLDLIGHRDALLTFITLISKPCIFLYMKFNPFEGYTPSNWIGRVWLVGGSCNWPLVVRLIWSCLWFIYFLTGKRLVGKPFITKSRQNLLLRLSVGIVDVQGTVRVKTSFTVGRVWVSLWVCRSGRVNTKKACCPSYWVISHPLHCWLRNGVVWAGDTF